MSQDKNANLRNGYCIYTRTFFQGSIPTVSDSDDKYVIFETELAAQREIADHAMIRIRQFLDGERDFSDAITIEEYVAPVDLHSDGSITDEHGRKFPTDYVVGEPKG